MGCGCGFIGSLVISPGSQSPVYTNPVRRGGESAVFSIEVLEIDSTVDLEITLQHKNSDETTWSTLATMSPAISQRLASSIKHRWPGA